MGGLSFWHILVIAAVLLVVFAHREIPALLGMLGGAIGRFRKAAKAARRPPVTIIEGRFERRDD